MGSGALSAACVVVLLGASITAPTLSGCERSASEHADAITDLTWEPRFARLSDELQRLAGFREAELGHLQMMDFADASQGETVEALREALIAAQPQIESCLTAAAELDGTMPELRWGDDSETATDAHLDRARARIQNTARLLEADAVRHWEHNEESEAWRRLIGVAQICEHLLAQPGTDHHQLGALIYYPLVYEAEALCADRPEPEHTPESTAFLEMVIELQVSLQPHEPRWREAIAQLRAALE
jgi:hypothetical protein